MRIFPNHQQVLMQWRICIYKRSNRPVMKGSRVETIEEARKEYKKRWKRVGRRQVYLQAIFEEKFFGLGIGITNVNIPTYLINSKFK